MTADCLPVALIAPEGVAMIHAGWRGLAADVLKKGVETLREAGAEGDIQAAIGPSIGVCCYEVNTWVHRAFMRYPRGVARLSNHAHLKNVARLQLQHAGVPLDTSTTSTSARCARRAASFTRTAATTAATRRTRAARRARSGASPTSAGRRLTEPINGLTAARVRANLAEVRERIAAAAARAGPRPRRRRDRRGGEVRAARASSARSPRAA